jgi:hypothetical protein
MLQPTKGMGHPSPPPSLASAALEGERATAAPRGWLDGPIINFAALGPQNHRVLTPARMGSPNRFRGGASRQIKENFLAPLMSETIRITVDARYRTR